MTREECKVLVKAMKAMYPDPKFIPDQFAFDMWYKLMGDLEYHAACNAFAKHAQLSKFPPTVAEIRQNVADMETVDGMNGEEAWSLVYKAISNSGYYSVEEFGKLPPIIQKSVGSPENLRELALMPADTVNSVEKSHFLRTYEVEKKRKRESDAISPEIRAKIQEMQMKALEG